MKFRCQMIPILLTLMAVIPWTTAVVNCWKACKNCRENTNHHPEILDVYCSMCRECRKRRGWMHNGGLENAPMEIHNDYQNQQNEFQPGCPPPPFCDSSGEQTYTQLSKLKMPSKLTSPAPILTSSTCPPYPSCIMRKQPTPQAQYPPQQYYPSYYPPQPPSIPQQDTGQHSTCSPCIPLCPMPCVPGGQLMPGSDNTQWSTKSNGQSNQKATEFSFVYVGVPKELVKEIG